MLQYVVDSAQAMSGCEVCCCESWALKPGVVEKVSGIYAPWSVPIGYLHCEPQFALEAKETCIIPVAGNLPPQVLGRIAYDVVPQGGHIDGDLRTAVTDPEGVALIFKTLPLYGPKQGKLVLDPTGVFDYDTISPYTGPDNFFLSASDGVNAPVIFEVLIGIGIPSSNVVATPSVGIDMNGVRVNAHHHLISFPVKTSPAAKLCEVWRLTVLQGALDCECQCYARSDCFDIKIAKC
jgi:hypothetical protein